MRQRFLCPGSKVELTDHANVIPAGTYTFVRRYDELLVFSVTKQVGFVLASSYWEHLVRPALDSRKSTRESTFLEEYAKRLQLQKSQANSIPQTAVSMCFMSKEALNRVARHLAVESAPSVLREAFPNPHEHKSFAA